MQDTLSEHPPEPLPRTPLLAGAVLGCMVVAWLFVMGLSGWYLEAARLQLLWVVVALHLGVLVVTLWRTRTTSGYRRQVGLGLMTSAVAAVIVFVGSAVLTTVALPGYFEELHTVRERELREGGMAQAEVEETLDGIAASQTPTGHAFAGLMGTLGTGFVISSVAAAFLRDRRRAVPGSPRGRAT